jgi:hypothetical protein
MAVADIHSDRSHVVCPTRTISDSEYSLKPLPVMLICMSPPHPPFAGLIIDTAPESADTDPPIDPTWSPDVTAMVLVRKADCDGKHSMVVIDIHADLSHAVCSTLIISVREYRLKTLPEMLMCMSSAHPSLTRLIPSVASILSTENTSVAVPTCFATVIIILMLPSADIGTIQRELVSEFHLVDSHRVAWVLDSILPDDAPRPDEYASSSLFGNTLPFSEEVMVIMSTEKAFSAVPRKSPAVITTWDDDLNPAAV